MTKLRDDGYLETDDAVVAACFLGMRVEFPDLAGNREVIALLQIEHGGLFYGNGEHENTCGPRILIPAKKVAEVIADAVHGSLTWFVIVATIPVADGTMAGGDWVLKTWTRTHTKEGT